MIIGVKIALDNAIATCQKYTSKKVKSAEALIVNDIYSFIFRTSTCKHVERFNYFCKLYLRGKYNATQFQYTPSGDLPDSLIACLSVSSNSQLTNQISDAKTVLSFFNELGNYYLSDRLAQRDTNKPAMIELLAQMRVLVGGIEEKSGQSESQSVKQAETYRINAESQSLHKDLGEIVPQEETIPPGESLEELLDKLNSLIGLAEVKKEVQTITNLIKLQRRREELGIK